MDITTILSGIEPEQSHFEVLDEDSALWCVGHITRANTKRAAIEARYKELKDRIDAWKEKELTEVQRTEEHMVALIQPWANREIARQKGKHIDLPTARIGLRSSPDKAVVDDEEAVISWAADCAPEILRVKTEVNKSELKKYLKEQDVPGAHLEGGYQRLYVEER